MSINEHALLRQQIDNSLNALYSDVPNLRSVVYLKGKLKMTSITDFTLDITLYDVASNRQHPFD